MSITNNGIDLFQGLMVGLGLIFIIIGIYEFFRTKKNQNEIDEEFKKNLERLKK